jgi:hypothetical protein
LEQQALVGLDKHLTLMVVVELLVDVAILFQQALSKVVAVNPELLAMVAPEEHIPVMAVVLVV